jgi:hypothetical protein
MPSIAANFENREAQGKKNRAKITVRNDTGFSGRSPKVNKIPFISFAFVLTLGAAPCSTQLPQAPSSAAAQSKEQGATKPFTHAEVAQFLHTVHTEAAGWTDTIYSVSPAALHLDHQATELVEKEKDVSLFVLDQIKAISLPTSEPNDAPDLATEFVVYSLLSQLECSAEGLSTTLGYNSMDGATKAGELLQVQKEVTKVDSALFKEILNRIVSITRSEKSGSCE